MKLYYLFVFIILFSCGGIQVESVNENKSVLIKQPNLAFHFKNFDIDTLIIDVNESLTEKKFSKEECIPLSYMQIFENFLQQTQAESTGIKPLGKIKLNDFRYFLILVQQDDYGPMYYGLTYNSEINKISEKFVIAYNWGDAGDFETAFSEVILINKKIKIISKIKICESIYEVKENEEVLSTVICKDTTVTRLVEIH